jgi:chaperonin GroES
MVKEYSTNESGIIPTGGHVLVLADTVEEKTAGGIILPESTRDKDQAAATSGTVISIGASAWADIDDGHPWASVGDHVSYARYAGVVLKGKDEVDYILLNDNDILAVLSF